MRTLRELVGSVQEQLKQTGDDRGVHFNQLVLWATWFVNKYINAQLQVQDTGSYLSVIPEVPVVNATATAAPNIIKGRKYSALPQSVFDMDLDRGIVAITYPYNFLSESYMHLSGVQFQRISMAKVTKLYYSPYEKPGADNPYFYVYGKYIGYLGVDNVPLSSVEMWLRTPYDPFTSHSLDDYIPVIDQFGPDIAKNVFEMGRFELLMPSDRVNDASAQIPGQDVPQSRAVSVNQEINTDQNAV